MVRLQMAPDRLTQRHRFGRPETLPRIHPWCDAAVDGQYLVVKAESVIPAMVFHSSFK
jgi:hypothetical protein